MLSALSDSKNYRNQNKSNLLRKIALGNLRQNGAKVILIFIVDKTVVKRTQSFVAEEIKHVGLVKEIRNF